MRYSYKHFEDEQTLRFLSSNDDNSEYPNEDSVGFEFVEADLEGDAERQKEDILVVKRVTMQWHLSLRTRWCQNFRVQMGFSSVNFQRCNILMPKVSIGILMLKQI